MAIVMLLYIRLSHKINTYFMSGIVYATVCLYGWQCNLLTTVVCACKLATHRLKHVARWKRGQARWKRGQARWKRGQTSKYHKNTTKIVLNKLYLLGIGMLNVSNFLPHVCMYTNYFIDENPVCKFQTKNVNLLSGYEWMNRFHFIA